MKYKDCKLLNDWKKECNLLYIKKGLLTQKLHVFFHARKNSRFSYKVFHFKGYYFKDKV